MATILAVETSCDETSVAIVKNRQICSNIVASQVTIHRAYGGVVPEVASRHHLEQINDCVIESIDQSGLQWKDIDAIACTCAPGLVGALLVGLTTAKTLAILHRKPFLGIHHLEGHIYASYLSEPNLKPPFLCLMVSGGHTSLIGVKDCGEYQVLGTTRDDAVGEAFDKVARLLGLGYPGGPAIDRIAKEGNAQAFSLPEGKVSLPQGGFHPYDCSFSGLKTAVRRLVERLDKETGGDIPRADIAASFQATVAKALVKRTIRCSIDYGFDTIVAGGGVAANSALRSLLVQMAQEKGIKVFFPPLQYCTDNAGMIACAGEDHFLRGDRSSLTLGVHSRLPLTEIHTLYE